MRTQYCNKRDAQPLTCRVRKIPDGEHDKLREELNRMVSLDVF